MEWQVTLLWSSSKAPSWIVTKSGSSMTSLVLITTPPGLEHFYRWKHFKQRRNWLSSLSCVKPNRKKHGDQRTAHKTAMWVLPSTLERTPVTSPDRCSEGA
eukprot:5157255-Amphidinium_carterae.1